MEKRRILLVDDNTLLRDALRTVLDARPNLQVIGQAGDGEEAIREAVRLTPDVILLDVRMPGLTGEETVVQLKRLVPRSKVIALSAFEDEESAQKMLAAGADAYVHKTGTPSDLLSEIESSSGRTSPGQPLLPQEVEVLRRFAQGYPLREIAVAVGLELTTVERYKAEGLEKLKLSSRAEVARVAAQQGWGTL